MGKIMVIAGEASGDMHAAEVVKEIYKMAPETRILGMGSSRLADEGVEIILDPTDISSIGFIEALKNFKRHYSHLKMMGDYIDRERPDVLFLVDYSGFNMLMARIAKKKGVPAVNYFPPTAWIWGKWRARWMARYDTTIAASFPMEREAYLRAGADVQFVGHPLLDMIEVKESKEDIYQRLELDPEKPVIGLLPGSRRGEIESLLPVMLRAAVKLQKEDHDLQFVLPLASGFKADKISDIVSKYELIIKVVEDYTYQVMKIADLLHAASGTVTVEATILQTPMIIGYKTSWSSYKLGKRVMNVDHVGMPNIIARKEIVPELIQDDMTAENIYRKTKNLLYKPYLISDMKKNLGWVKKMLGVKGAVKKTAKLVLQKGDIDYREE